MRVELSGGHHAELREAETIRRREISDARRATDRVVGVETKDILFMDIVVASLLERWSLDLPLPRTVRTKVDGVKVIDGESLEELSPADYKTLFDAANEIHRVAREGIDTGPDTSPDSPTTPSSD